MRNVVVSTWSKMMMVGVCVCVTGGIAYADGDHAKEKVEMANKAKVSLEEAIQIASKEMQGTIIEAELEDEHGSLMWDLEFVTPDGKVREIHLDAVTGKAIGH